jgi:hypothetical protein
MNRHFLITVFEWSYFQENRVMFSKILLLLQQIQKVFHKGHFSFLPLLSFYFCLLSSYHLFFHFYLFTYVFLLLSFVFPFPVFTFAFCLYTFALVAELVEAVAELVEARLCFPVFTVISVSFPVQ